MKKRADTRSPAARRIAAALSPPLVRLGLYALGASAAGFLLAAAQIGASALPAAIALTAALPFSLAAVCSYAGAALGYFVFWGASGAAEPGGCRISDSGGIVSVPRRDFPFQPLFPAGAFRRNLRDDGADFSFERACTCFRRRHFSRKNGADLSVQRAVFRAVGKKAGGNRRARRVSSGKRQPTDAAAGAAAESDSIGLRGAFMQRLAVFPAGSVRLLDHSGGKLSPGLQRGRAPGALAPSCATIRSRASRSCAEASSS